MVEERYMQWSEEKGEFVEGAQRHIHGRLYDLFAEHDLKGGVFLAGDDALDVVVREQDTERASQLVKDHTDRLTGVPVKVWSNQDALKAGIIGQTDVDAIEAGQYGGRGQAGE